jgi:hypothetical protein
MVEAFERLLWVKSGIFVDLKMFMGKIFLEV